MTFARRFRFYLIGVGLGLVVVLFIFGPRAISCSYFPNDRVIAEALAKEMKYRPEVKDWLIKYNRDKKFIKDTLFSGAKITNFGTPEARQEPCGVYKAQKDQYHFTFQICKKETWLIKIAP